MFEDAVQLCYDKPMDVAFFIGLTCIILIAISPFVVRWYQTTRNLTCLKCGGLCVWSGQANGPCYEKDIWKCKDCQSVFYGDWQSELKEK